MSEFDGYLICSDYDNTLTYNCKLPKENIDAIKKIRDGSGNMKILSIGNSFSTDATRYLHQIARCANENVKIINLFIGGCSLKQHYINALEDYKKYILEVNGYSSGFFVSIKEALISDDWDYITLQQVSSKSIDYDTYQPYLNFLCEYVKKYSPKTKIVLHQTWAYENDSYKLCEELGFKTSNEMFKKIEQAYEKANQEIHADGIIRCGEVFQAVVDSGIESIHRDTFHAKLGIGRYILGLIWFKYFTKKSVLDNPFDDFDEPVSSEEIEISKRAVEKLI